MISQEQLNQLKEKFKVGEGETRYSNCWLDHPRCAIEALIEELEHVNKLYNKLGTAVDLLMISGKINSDG